MFGSTLVIVWWILAVQNFQAKGASTFTRRDGRRSITVDVDWTKSQHFHTVLRVFSRAPRRLTGSFCTVQHPRSVCCGTEFWRRPAHRSRLTDTLTRSIHNCSFQSTKILLFLPTSTLKRWRWSIINWRLIDVYRLSVDAPWEFAGVESRTHSF